MHSIAIVQRLDCAAMLFLWLPLSLQSTFNSHIMTQHEYHMLNVNIVIYPLLFYSLSITFLSNIRAFFLVLFCFVSSIRIAFIWLTQSDTTMKMMKMCNNLTFNQWKTEIDSHKRYNEIRRNMYVYLCKYVWFSTCLSHSNETFILSLFNFHSNEMVVRKEGGCQPGWLVGGCIGKATQIIQM